MAVSKGDLMLNQARVKALCNVVVEGPRSSSCATSVVWLLSCSSGIELLPATSWKERLLTQQELQETNKLVMPCDFRRGYGRRLSMYWDKIMEVPILPYAWIDIE